jgi:hypothetical protein
MWKPVQETVESFCVEPYLYGKIQGSGGVPDKTSYDLLEFCMEIYPGS